MNCPKCGSELEEYPEPERHIIAWGSDMTVGGETLYDCPECGACWEKEDLEGEKDE